MATSLLLAIAAKMVQKDYSCIDKMDASAKEIVSHLKFIGMIKKHQKINVSQMFVHQPGFISSLSRSVFYRDSRRNALNFIENTLSRSFEIIYKFKDSDRISELSLCQHIIKDMVGVHAGLENMKVTYAGDIRFICDLETIQQTIIPRLKEVKAMKASLFVIDDEDILLEASMGELREEVKDIEEEGKDDGFKL